MLACGSLNMIKLFTPQKLHLAELSLSQQVVPIAFLVLFFVNFSCGKFAFFAKCDAFLGPKNRAFVRCLAISICSSGFTGLLFTRRGHFRFDSATLIIYRLPRNVKMFTLTKICEVR